MLMKLIAFFLLALAFPLCVFIAIILWLQSCTSFIFNQVRVGLDQKDFVIYKFKTMEQGKITPVGRVLRKLGLDEIPQLYNIIKGDMSFVGPRPLTSADIERLSWKDQSLRWSVLPGITGLAQLTNICDANVSLQNDLYYVQHKSLSLDVKLFFRSLVVPFVGKRTG